MSKISSRNPFNGGSGNIRGPNSCGQNNRGEDDMMDEDSGLNSRSGSVFPFQKGNSRFGESSFTRNNGFTSNSRAGGDHFNDRDGSSSSNPTWNTKNAFGNRSGSSRFALGTKGAEGGSSGGGLFDNTKRGR